MDQRLVGNSGRDVGGSNRLLPMLVSAKEEWKRALGFIVAFPGEDQRMTVLRTESTKGRREDRFLRPKLVGMRLAYEQPSGPLSMMSHLLGMLPFVGQKRARINGKRQLIPYLWATGMIEKCTWHNVFLVLLCDCNSVD